MYRISLICEVTYHERTEKILLRPFRAVTPANWWKNMLAIHGLKHGIRTQILPDEIPFKDMTRQDINKIKFLKMVYKPVGEGDDASETVDLTNLPDYGDDIKIPDENHFIEVHFAYTVEPSTEHIWDPVFMAMLMRLMDLASQIN
jgi:hypothetical protein